MKIYLYLFQREISDGAHEHQPQLLDSRSSPLEFDGVCMGDEAQKSVVGLEAYKNYFMHTSTPIDLPLSKETFNSDLKFTQV